MSEPEASHLCSYVIEHYPLREKESDIVNICVNT